MKGRIGLAALLLAGAALAGPREDSVIAAMRLSEETGYSWVSTVTDDARTYEIRGETERGGYSRVRMPVINAVRRQLGRSVTDTQVELIFAGNVDCMIETDAGWRRPEELPPAPEPARGAPAGVSANPGLPIPGLPPAPSSRGSSPPYSNLQLALSHPHEELGVIVSSHETWEIEADHVRGRLSDAGARLLLVRDGQRALTPLRAAGEFVVWMHQGRVTRYRVSLEGILQVRTASQVREVTVRQTTETFLSNQGRTRVTVPEEVRSRLPLADSGSR